MDGLIDLRTSTPSPTEPRPRPDYPGKRAFQRRMIGGVLLLVGILLGPTARAVAQSSPRAEVHVSADSVKVGERFTITLVAEHTAGTRVVFPTADAGSALFGDLTVLRRERVQKREAAGGRRVDSVAYEVATFALDSVHVPILPIRVIGDQDTTILGTSPRVVPVVSVVPSGATGLRTPAALAPFPRPLWMWGLLGLATAMLLGGLLYAWSHWRTDDEPTPRAEDDQDPYEVALTRLQHLGRRNPNDRETCKAFYVDLTETLRVYMARRMGVRALECTTAELVEALRRRREIPKAAIKRIRTVLERADLVKFAGMQPKPEVTQGILEKARGVLGALEAAQRRAETRAPDEGAPA